MGKIMKFYKIENILNQLKYVNEKKIWSKNFYYSF